MSVTPRRHMVDEPGLRQRASVGELAAALGLVAGIYAVQFLLSGAKIFHLMLAFRVYRGWDSVEAIPVEYQFDLEAVLPNLIGAAVLGDPTDNPDAVMLRYQAVATGFLLLVGLFGVWRRSITPTGLALLFVLAQVAKLNLAWLGKPDMLLVGFLLLIVWFVGRPVTAVFGFLAALCHPMISVLACCVLATGMLLLGTHRLNSVRGVLSYLWAPLGALAGFLAGTVFLRLRFPTMAGRVAAADERGTDLYLNVMPNLVVFAVLVVFPIVTFYLLVRDHVRTPEPVAPAAVRHLALIATAVGCFILSAFIVLDHSRVWALITLPALSLAIALHTTALTEALRRNRALVVYLLLVVMALPGLVMEGWFGFTHKGFEEWLAQLGRIVHP